MMARYGWLPVFACQALVLCAQQSVPAASPALFYERMFGGSNTDIATSVTTDLQGNILVVGTTDSVDFPTTPGTFKPVLPGSLQARFGDPSDFHTVPLGRVERVNTIVFSADGLVGYLAAITIDHNNAIYRTSDSGRTWQQTAANPTDSPSALVVDPLAPSTVYALTPVALYKSSDSGNSWVKITSPAPKSYTPTFLAIDPTNDNRLFLILGYRPSQVLRSTDGGISWMPLSTGLPYSANSIAIDPNEPNIVYSVGSFENVFRSRDGGDTWTQLLPGTSPSFVNASLAVDFASAIYVPTAKGVYRSTDQGNSYTLIPTPDGSFLYRFQVDPKDSSHFLLATGSERVDLWESRDGGVTWLAIHPAVSLLTDLAVRGDSIYVATAPANQVFVTKWNSLQGTLAASTYLGPAGLDAAPKVVTDQNGFVYISGETSSSEFPVTPNAFLTKPGRNGSRVGFVTKLSPDLSQIIWSTFVGSGSRDSDFTPSTYISDLQVDSSGSVYMAGVACAPDFPAKTISLGIPPRPIGLQDTISCGLNSGGGFVAKLNTNGTALIYAAKLSGSDDVLSLALDRSGTVYVSGAVANRISPGFNGIVPIGPSYLARISASGESMERVAVLPATASATSISLTPAGELLVTGATRSSLLPAFLGAFQLFPTQKTCYQSGSDAYVLRTTPDLVLTAFSFLGAGCEEGRSVRSDRFGNIWVSGYSISNGLPLRFPYQSTGQGFVAELSPNANALLFSSKTDFAPQLNISREGAVSLASTSGRSGSLRKNFLYSTAGGTALLTRVNP